MGTGTDRLPSEMPRTAVLCVPGSWVPPHRRVGWSARARKRVQRSDAPTDAKAAIVRKDDCLPPLSKHSLPNRETVAQASRSIAQPSRRQGVTQTRTAPDL